MKSAKFKTKPTNSQQKSKNYQGGTAEIEAEIPPNTSFNDRFISVEMNLHTLFANLASFKTEEDASNILRSILTIFHKPCNGQLHQFSQHFVNQESSLYKLLQNQNLKQDAIKIIAIIIHDIDNPDPLVKFLRLPQIPVELVFKTMQRLKVLMKMKYESNPIENKYPTTVLMDVLNISWNYAFYDEEKMQDMSQTYIELTPAQSAEASLSLMKVDVTKKGILSDVCIDCFLADMGLSPIDQSLVGNLEINCGFIRCLALCLMRYVVKEVESKVLFSLWSYFVYPGSPSLRQIIKQDKCLHTKIAALLVLHDLIARNINYIKHAEKPRTIVTSFTSFSETLGVTVLKLHDALLSVLDASTAYEVYFSLLCLRVLISWTPYSKIAVEVLSEIIRKIFDILIDIEKLTNMEKIAAKVQNECFKVLLEVMKSEQIEKRKIDKQLDDIFKLITDHLTVNCTEIQITSQCVCLQILRSYYKKYFTLEKSNEIYPILKQKLSNSPEEVYLHTLRLIEIINLSFCQFIVTKKQETLLIDDDVKVYLKFWLDVFNDMFKLRQRINLDENTQNGFDQVVESTSKDMNRILEINDLVHKNSKNSAINNNRRKSNKRSQRSSKTIDKDICNKLVECKMKKAFDQRVKFEHFAEEVSSSGNFKVEIVACICDCLGSLHSSIFEAMSSSMQGLTITSLQSEANDISLDAAIRGAAIRALSMGILDVRRCEDDGFIADMLELFVKNLFDYNVDVRTKTAWALSNLTDAIVLNFNEDQPGNAMLSISMLCSLYNGIACALLDTNSKVKCNIIRAAGNAFIMSAKLDTEPQNSYQIASSLSRTRDTTNENVDCHIDRIATELMHIVTHSRDMKIQWNACYALGVMLNQSDFYSRAEKLQQIRLVFEKLMQVIEKSNNFKVRINAISALTMPTTRECYGEYWLIILKALIKSLHGCENIDNFKEYQHKETLIEQICIAIAHLILLANLNDIVTITDTILSNYDVLKHHVSRILERAVPERVAQLQKASNHVRELENVTEYERMKLGVGQEVVVVLEKLKELFVNRYL